MQPSTLEKIAKRLEVTVWELTDDSIAVSVFNN